MKAASMSYIVTTRSSQGLKHSLVWDPSAPLPLGYPLQWIVEKTEDGARIRHVSPERGSVHKGGLTLVSEQELSKGAEIELPASGRKTHLVALSIRPARRVLPVYEDGKGDRLSAFACSGLCIVDSAPVEKDYEGRAEKKTVFSLNRKGSSYELTVAVEGVALAHEGKKGLTAVARGEKLKLESSELVATRVLLGSRSWRFGMATEVAIPAPPKGRVLDADLVEFKKSVRNSMGGLVALLILAFFWPKAEPTPVDQIPPQIARIVLAKPASAQAEAAGANVAKSENQPKTKVQETKVVQAFRAKALQSAVSKLLKGGMTKLLTQSDFVAGSTASASTGRLFDAKSAALKATGPEIGLSNQKSVMVASLGSEGIGAGKGGKSVGYGKGERAGVKGQGEGFVSMDIGNSSVEEGLTKEEVGKVIHAHLAEIRYCYESAMIRSPDVEGKLVMDFTIGSTGAVKVSNVKQSTTPDPKLDDCVNRRLVTWQFPKTKGGVDVAVTYPFIFKTLGR
ncbi:MAG TPA: AgmX/PglI C-terminal domain-containing protein [Bdellovibrionota bacterium]|nr:AgmX/PglI C-terminal domain-containing protein [Bdellovibrionota bacterium]